MMRVKIRATPGGRVTDTLNVMRRDMESRHCCLKKLSCSHCHERKAVSISDWALRYEGSVCLGIGEPSGCLAAYYKSSFPYCLIKLVFLHEP